MAFQFPQLNLRKRLGEFFKPTPELRFRDIIREIGVVGRELGQDIARNIASAGLTIATTLAPKELKPYTSELSANKFFEPLRGVMKAMFRDEPIKSIEQRIVEAEPKVKEWGIQLKKQYPNTGLGKVGSFIEQNPTTLAFAGIMGSVGIDLSFFGGIQKNAFKALIKTKTAGEAISVLSKMGIADDIAKTFADDVVKIADTKSAAKLFNSLAEIQRTTKVTPVVKGIVPPIKPPKIPPTPPPAEMPQFAGKPIEDPIAVLNTLLKEAKPVRGKLERAYTTERARRIGEVDRFITEQIDNVGGEEGYAKILSKLKGELAPEAKIRFEPIKNKLSEEQLKGLYIRTWKHPYLDNWEKISAAGGLNDLLMGGIPQPKQLVLLEEIYGTDLIKNLLSKRLLGAKATDFLIELVNIPRMFLATADMSGLLRQGVIAVAHPIIWTKSAIKTFQFAFSPKSFEQYFKDLPKDPLYSLMRKSGIAITDPSRIAGGLAAREEAFISRLIQNLPVIGIPFRFAERSYVGFLNKLRVDWFKSWADELLSKGLSPTKDIDIFKSAAEVINTFTGRGSLGKLNKIAPELSVVFFSPRLISARFNALNPVWYAQMPPEIRKKAIGDFAKFVSAGLTTLSMIYLYKKATGASDEELSIEPDPRSSDFGKIKMENTRFDIWGGFQQWARVFAQLITGERKNTSTGEIISLTKDEYPFTTRKEVLLRFIENKLAPMPALVNELISGAKTFTGEDITLETTIKDKFIPMYIQDIADAYADGGLGRATGVGVAAFFGVGVQTWEERGKILPPAGFPTMGLPLMPGIKMPTFPGAALPPMPGIR